MAVRIEGELASRNSSQALGDVRLLLWNDSRLPSGLAQASADFEWRHGRSRSPHKAHRRSPQLGPRQQGYLTLSPVV
jgi:hypothetical protein